ncbi:MAG: hypothetical protein B6D64_01075 [Bacteroidetes bacterium 4484_276]|nr:MAG: hypothetical protein B6D64_01075 [Bacteroidetes bacterium 4484_276]
MKKIILNILLFVMATSFLNAQIPVDKENMGFVKNLTEQVQIYTDRDLYLSGEEVWFTAYVVINNTFNEFELSKIVYIELFDAAKKKFFKGKFEVINGTAAGSFQIPVETISGSYFIRAYTQYQRNFPPGHYATNLITIINPEFPLPAPAEQKTDTLKNDDLGLPVYNPDLDIEVTVQADKPIYQKRGLVELKIQVPELDTNEITSLNVAVVRKGTFRKPESCFTPVSGEGTDLKKDNKHLFWVPETRGVSISGIVTENKSLKPLAGASIYLSVLGDCPQFHITQTKDNGAFLFPLGYLDRGHEIFVGVRQVNEEEIRLLINSDFSNDFTTLQNIPVAIDSTHKFLLGEMLVNYQSQMIFAPHKEQITKTSPAGIEIFGEPEISVSLADFIDLPNLESIIFELVHTVSVRNKNGRKSLSVLNPETNRVFTNQLLLLDHVPVFDVDAVLTIPPAKIENINVINRTRYLGDNILRSVVMMNTKAGDFAGYIFPEGSIFVEYQTITPGKKFKSPTYKTQSEKSSSIPDFRTTLYWVPELSLSKSDTTIRFYSSDNTGDYGIIVRGVTKEGKTCFGRGGISIQ